MERKNREIEQENIMSKQTNMNNNVYYIIAWKSTKEYYQYQNTTKYPSIHIAKSNFNFITN